VRRDRLPYAVLTLSAEECRALRPALEGAARAMEQGVKGDRRGDTASAMAGRRAWADHARLLRELSAALT